MPFERGYKLEQEQKLDEAFHEYEQAARLAPQNTEYLAAAEITRQNLAGSHMQQGNQLLQTGHQAEALAEFRELGIESRSAK